MDAETTKIYELLKQVAIKGGVVTLEEIANLVNFNLDQKAHRKEISKMLDEISAHEHKDKRPLLPAVVIAQDNYNLKLPGKGFFKSAKKLRVFDGIDETSFYHRELEKVYEHWTSCK
jgi:hypothetical protein